jgi:competence transcription factor ComK
MFQYPWYSVDSSSWRIRGGGYGLIDLPANPQRLKTKEDYFIISKPISKGVQKHKKTDISNSLAIELQQFSQMEVTKQQSPLYMHYAELLLQKYGYTFSLLENDAMKRSIWNALYLFESAAKFTNTVIFVGSNSIKPVRFLFNKLEELGLHKNKYLNVIVSYSAIKNKDNRSRIMEQFLTRKKHW